MFGIKRKIYDAAKDEPIEAKQIQFRHEDSMHQRATNIWYALGMANDRMNAIPQIAGWLSMYRDWDQQTRATTPPTSLPETKP